MPALHDQPYPSILALGSHVTRDEQIDWLRNNRARGIREIFGAVLRGDWHSVGVLAREVAEDESHICGLRKTYDARAEWVRYRDALVDALLREDWAEVDHFAYELRKTESYLSGRKLAARDDDFTRRRADFLRERLRHERHLMQGRRFDTLDAFLTRTTEVTAEIAGMQAECAP